MSENGKGSNTAKRTNLKKFNDGYDNISWGAAPRPPKLPADIQQKIDDISNQIDNYEQSLHDTIDRQNGTGE